MQMSWALLCCGLIMGNLLGVFGGGWQEDVSPKVILDKEPDDTITYSGNGSFTDFFKIFVRDGKNILVGARNAVYNLTAAGLKLNHKLEWYSEEDDIQMCLTKGKDPENCQNYIRVLSVVSPGKILVCGTNAYKPRCRHYHLSANNHYSQVGAEKTGQGICPYDPRHNSTSTYVDGEVYAGTVADFTEVDSLIHRWDSLRTTQYDLKYLNAPNFVGSMEYEDFVFLYFRETSEEYTNCGKAVYSRVGRVCKSDKGFPRGTRNRWTTFLKSRLNCSIPGEFPFYFDEIQSTSSFLPTSQFGNEVVYGVFTTGVNSLTGSAVCAFKMRDVLDVFDGRFKAQEGTNMQWLPVDKNKVPEPRPGICVNDSTTLPDQYHIFVAAHTLMDEAVQPLLGRPLLTRATESSRLTAIAVHTNATTPDGQSYDVIFIGQDDGKILSVVNVGRENNVKTIVIQEMQVFKTPVKEMLFLGGSPPKLLVGTDHNLKLMNVRQCFTTKIKSCSDCVALQSPYCAWHKRESKCVTIPLDRPISRRDYIQNVSTGNHSDCPKFNTMNSNAIPSEQHKSTSKSQDSSAGSQTILDDGQPTKEVVNEGSVVIGTQMRDSYTAETLSIAVGVGCILAILLGFLAGWGCAKRCRKDHDNIPYPDTDYEYFEQGRVLNHNINTRLMGEGKEEATYAEPVLDVKNNSNMNNMNMMPQVNHQPDHQETTMFHFAQPYARDLYRFEGDLNSRGRPDPFGSLRPGGGMHLDSYGTAHRQPSLGPKPNIPNINDGYGTARSVKKVYL